MRSKFCRNFIIDTLNIYNHFDKQFRTVKEEIVVRGMEQKSSRLVNVKECAYIEASSKHITSAVAKLDIHPKTILNSLSYNFPSSSRSEICPERGSDNL